MVWERKSAYRRTRFMPADLWGWRGSPPTNMSLRAAVRSESKAREKTMKIGVLGGTFDPIHNGHLELARAAQNQYGLDEIWFVPASIPPHKVSSSDRASSKHRFEMVKLAAASEPRFKVSDEELSREGISYTYD
ncbi:MAG: adenylyltransferase/cytidyltransferase family protein, partial [Candidatus Omnitrophica bacterium]|nr:adenylyltransferase/cytidyltransferase family protein [Candidatus Omnitrophota bacterium]